MSARTNRQSTKPPQETPGGGLGARIKEAHEHAGKTQSRLERELIELGFGGSSRGYLTRMVSGERSGRSVDPHLIEAIADLCAVDFHWLATGRGKMLPAKTPPIARPRPSNPPPSRAPMVESSVPPSVTIVREKRG